MDPAHVWRYIAYAVVKAIGLPITLDDGTPFPMRNEIIFLSVAVVLLSLLGQGLSLPWIVRKFSRQPSGTSL